MAGNRSNWKCKECNLTYNTKDKKKQQWIECDGCDGKYDFACLNMTESNYQALNDLKSTFWLCKYCEGKYKLVPINSPLYNDNISVLLDNINTTVGQIQDTVNNLHTEVIENLPSSIEKSNETKFEEIEKNITHQIKTNINAVPEEAKRTWAEETKKTWADLFKTESDSLANMISKQNPQPAITIDNFKKAMEELSEQDKENEIRARGIVVYRAPEDIRADKDSTSNREDEMLISELVNYLGGAENEILSVNRLGRFSEENIREERYRPIKVRFDSKEARNYILKNLNKLKNAPARLKKLSIRQDLNEKQRQELQSKFAEAKERSKDLTGSVFRVRGSPGSYKLVEFQIRNPQHSNFGSRQTGMMGDQLVRHENNENNQNN